MKNLPWTVLQEMKGNTSVLKKIEEAEKLLKSLRKEQMPAPPTFF
jgi:ParB family transcriptional regulator, chromosome partitioning protein